MSAWHEFPITIICLLLLLLSLPESIKASERGERMSPNLFHNEATALCKRKVDIQHLYDAYRDRLKEANEDAKQVVALTAEKPSVAGDDEDDSLKKHIETKKNSEAAIIRPVKSKDSEDREKGIKAINQSSPPIKNEANEQEAKCVPKQNGKKVQAEESNVKDKSVTKEPVVKSMVILKMDLPSKEKIEPKDTATKAQNAMQDTAERRIAELNRVYKEFISVWKRPTTESKNQPSKPGIADQPIHLNALNDLMNVLENLKHRPNLLDDMVKIIDDEMNGKSFGATPNKLNANVNLIQASQPQRKGDLLKSIQTDRSPTVIKRLAIDSKNVNPNTKTGGLYEDYKKKLHQILKAHNIAPPKSLTKEQKISLGSSIAKELNSKSQCQCDARKPMVLAIDSDGAKISNALTHCQCEATKTGSSDLGKELVQCHCEPMKATNMADVANTCMVDPKLGLNNDYLQTREKCVQTQKANNLNGGLKPYYISNSKERQMIWNDIPFVKPASKEKPKPQSVPQAQPQPRPIIEAIKPEKAPEKHLESDTENSPGNSEGQTKEQSDKTEQNMVDESVDKSPPLATAPHKKEQLQHLLKVLQAKHRLDGLRKASKRALINMQPGNLLGTQPRNIAFPEVLVSPVGAGMGQPTGGRMIENMAKQLNVSPMEMAQRIASSGSNMGTGIPISSESQTNGCQVSSATTPNQHKITSDAAVFSQQQVPVNLGPMLEKILNRLQVIQDTNLNRDLASSGDKLPCCFAEPTDGAPCDITGSWESVLLGIRINIRDDNKVIAEHPKPVCAQPKIRTRRQCVKITPGQIKDRFHVKQSYVLNVTIEETLPPRRHEMMDNITDWVFTGHALSTLGGPLSLSCHSLGCKLMGSFVGVCRTCGCIDTIFGSWTFCLPSRDCQDITMSIFDRRDMWRRYTLDDSRRERLKEHLYKKNSLAKLEKNSL